MKKVAFNVNPKASVSLASVVGRRANRMPASAASRAAGLRTGANDQIRESDRIPLLVEADNAQALRQEMPNAPDEMVTLAPGFVSCRAGASTVESLLKTPKARRIQTKKEKTQHLDEVAPEVRLAAGVGGARTVPETGAGVLIGVIDSGFDLSHPVFRDGNGRLRVERLLDQQDQNREFDTAALEQAWAQGRGPGADLNGHGTHVASIAGGSRFLTFEGVAPAARFLLVRTDFINTDTAVSWVFQAANNTPCVVNMSLGHHFGAHDGTDSEERLHRALVGAGKIIVVSAGNERGDNLHIRGQFHAGQTLEAPFRILRRQGGEPGVAITLWYADTDTFDIALVTPSGQEIPVPALNQSEAFSSSQLDIEVSRRAYVFSNLTQAQVSIGFRSMDVPDLRLRGWKLKLTCQQAAVGLLDGWFNNSGFARFDDSPLVTDAGTVGLPATGGGCLTVASHVSRNTWVADAGNAMDSLAVVGRTSPFSSVGPVRDGRQKPELSAPGQYVTAALADQSSLAGVDERALVASRALTIEGTSMAAPVVAGVIALMLQKRGTLTPDDIRQILRATCRHDAHTGAAEWDPSYGFGKIDVAAALAAIP